MANMTSMAANRLYSCIAHPLAEKAVFSTASFNPLAEKTALSANRCVTQELASLLDTIDGQQEAMDQTAGTDLQAEDIG